MGRRRLSVFSLLLLALLMVPFRTQAQQPTPSASDVEAPAGGLSRSRQGPGKSALELATGDSYVAPRETLLQSIARANLGPNASQVAIEAAARQYLAEWHETSYHGPDLDDYMQLVQNEQRALAAGSSPAAMGLGVEGLLRLLTVAVEFTGTDTVENFSHPISLDDRTCITETVTYSGPVHNQIPHPGPRDNFSGWKSDYNQEYYEKLVLSTEGITERVRLDLTDPEDGLPGMDVSGQTMRNYFEEVSGGKVQFDVGPAGVIGWVPLPHSEGYYAADACVDGDAGRVQSMDGLSTNPRGIDQLLIDMIDKINEMYPNFPWSDYDLNGDTVVDHVVVFHAGKDRSAGGGQQGTQAIWAHRGSIGSGGYVADDKGTADPSDDIRMMGYTMQYEDVETGVLVHEFGHDLGLPDLYDYASGGESSVVWWDLMSTGSNSGKLIGTHPTHMGAWTKFALGWADPEVITPTLAKDEFKLGQTSNPPAGSAQALRVNLPDHITQHVEMLTGSTQAWWTGHDQNWADLRLTRDVDLTGATGAISISFDADWIIEEDWDYMFLEVSVDSGQTYTQTKGFEVGTNAELTTPDGYGDPNQRMRDYGGLRYGYTGDSHGWIRAYHDLSAYAGQQIKVRFRQATDAGYLDRGAFVDNIVIAATSGTIFSDPVENNNTNGWVPTVTTFSIGEPMGQGWLLSDGLERYAQYYLVEWRNFDGFDEGLRYTYNTVFAEITAEGGEEFHVNKVAANVPGMIVYHRDTRFGLEPFDAVNSIIDPAHFFARPSEGPKGGLLVIDAHPMPVRGPRNGQVTNNVGTFPYPPANNWGGRFQSTNAAFGLVQTSGVTLTVATGAAMTSTTILTPTWYAPMDGVDGFHDSLGFYPGIEALTVPISTSTTNLASARKYALTDPDASAVVPAKAYYAPKTPAGFTGVSTTGNAYETWVPFWNGDWINEAGTAYCAAGLTDTSMVFNLGGCSGPAVTGQQSGNPGDQDLQYGNHFKVIGHAKDGSYGTIQIWNAQYAADYKASYPVGGTVFPVTVTVRNTGSPDTLTVSSDFDEKAFAFVEGSEPANATVVRNGAGLATSIVWTSPTELKAGETASFTYQLVRILPHGKIVNTVTGTNLSDVYTEKFGTKAWIPITSR